MAAISAADLLDGIRRSKLLESVHFKELTEDLRTRFPEARALAAELIRREWLTSYQANQLLQGRGDSLLLGSYILLEKLGEGGMGQVFKARNWKLGRAVGLKIIRKDRLENSDAVRRFQREIRAAAQLDHAHIVRAYDADEVAGCHLLVMEYVQGTDLAKLVKQKGPLPIDKACDYMRQTALGLQHACERGMVHRDIKPPNLLVTPAGVVKILDMGLARLDRKADDESATMTREGTVMGTLDYISPEQAMDSHGVDIRADLYSLGCTLYFLLTGKVPFPGGEALQKLLKHRLEEPIPVERHRPDVPPSVAAVVRKLMAKRPDDRYQTPDEAAAALASALDHESQTGELAASVSATQITGTAGANGDAAGWSSVVAARSTESPPPPRRPRPPLRIQPALLAGAAIGVIVLGLGLLGLFRFLPRAPRPDSPESRSTRPLAVIGPETPKAPDLSPSEQVARLVAELKRLNPGFDGTVKPTIEDGVVTGLEFLTDNVTDVSPVRALPGLRTLKCGGLIDKRMGRLANLSPLKDMKLTSLSCGETMVSDLSPLKDMKLTFLDCHATGVSNLSPLKDMKLTHLECWGTPVSDLSPLQGMKLTYLNFRWTFATDLSPLKDMPLKELHCDFQPWRDAEILHSIKTVERINGQPAADFWKEADKQQAEFNAWCKEVAAQPAQKQWQAVAAKLKETNRGFDGTVKPLIQDDVVTGLEFLTDNVTDISPVRALTGLRLLNCMGSADGKGRLSNLSPLKGLKLTALQCSRTEVSDLAPLQGMPLTYLQCTNTKVTNLTPLIGVPLKELNCCCTQVTDLSPLKDMPLERFFCHYTPVSDLTPLQGLKLTVFYCDHTKASDLSPLMNMPLKELNWDFQPARDRERLRSIKTLETINGLPAASFWKVMDNWQAEFAAWCKHVAALSAEDQARAVAAKLEELNPGFDGKVKPRTENGVVTGFEFWTDHVTDISPVRALTGLKTLRCGGSQPRTGGISDLAPLQGMGLENLFCSNNKASDLSPLKGMPLKELACNGNHVSALTPLIGMELTFLDCGGNPVADLSPLKGMPLVKLYCHYTAVSDLGPLKGMSLKQLLCDFNPQRDAEILRSIKTLENINGKPAADFWKDVDKQQAAFEAWCNEVAALPADKQVEAVAAKLKELNPGFDAMTKPVIDDGVVTGLYFVVNNVTDISPVRALKGLKGLRCYGSDQGKGKLADLAPLKGMMLTEVSCWYTEVSDLSPLKDMKLKSLNFENTKVFDLTPIKDMPLVFLRCRGTKVSDLSPLKGMKLKSLFCDGTLVSDLSPLRGMPLQELGCDFDAKRDAEILRSIPTLVKINDKSAADFWKEVDKTQSALEAWTKEVAALPAEKQVEAVSAKLKELNPGFDGAVKSVIENGVVASLNFVTDDVTDISPVRALKALKRLRCCGSLPGRGKLADLSPLKDKMLSELGCWNTEVSDLSPLKDMKMTSLSCENTKVSDLTPLKDLKLRFLFFADTKVSDLSPLKDMELVYLRCRKTKVSDLSPLRGMPLKEIGCDFDVKRDAEILRSIKTLEKINDKPAADFWKDLDQQQTGIEKWCKEVAALPAAKQVEAVAAKLKELNPGFDGTVKPTIEGGVVTGLEFVTDKVTDVSPVRALNGLKSLHCQGSDWRKGGITKLSPLKGMALTHLDCTNNNVSDLSPLRGLPLTKLECNGNQISDLRPLMGMELTYLNCGGNKLSDLAPLKGMPLAYLACHYSSVSNLEPLKGMPLTYLFLSHTAVSDLAPLKGMPLTQLLCENTGVFDLTPLKGMPLFHLLCGNTPVADLTPLEHMQLILVGLNNTKVSDLSPLKDMKLTQLRCEHTQVSDLKPLRGMPLKKLSCDFQPRRDAEILRSIKTLEKINDRAAAEVLKQVGETPPKR